MKASNISVKDKLIVTNTLPQADNLSKVKEIQNLFIIDNSVFKDRSHRHLSASQ